MKKGLIIKIIMFVILIVIVCVTGIYIFNLNEVTVESNNFYQYYAGRKIEYQANIEKTNKDGITKLSAVDIDIQFDTTPLYYKDIQDRVIFPESMEIIEVSENGQTYKINKFSEVYMNQDVAYIEYKDEVKELPNSFMYDGADMYFFISNATLEIDGTTYEIAPLSYVQAYNKNSVEIYNKQKDEYQTIETTNQAIVTIDNCTINVSTDTMMYNESEQILLHNMNGIEEFM